MPVCHVNRQLTSRTPQDRLGWGTDCHSRGYCGPWPCTSACVELSPACLTEHEQPCTQVQKLLLAWPELTSSVFSSTLALFVMAAMFRSGGSCSYLIS